MLVCVCACVKQIFKVFFPACFLYIYTHDAFVSPLSIANGYISARASPGLLSVSTVSNGNSMGKVVPAKSPPPSSPQMVSSRKPDLRVITSQSSKSLIQLVRTRTHLYTHAHSTYRPYYTFRTSKQAVVRQLLKHHNLI